MGVVGNKTRQRLAAVTMDDEVFDGPSQDDVAEREPQRVGRFPLIRRLGAGGMGAVYAAYDELLDRRIALKLMHRQRGGSVGQKQRTLVEARSLARITHPSIVTVYEVGEAEGHVYISMEYIEGPTLSDWCSDAPRSWRQILEMYLQAGEALAAAHAAGIVHRDFKPDNVLVGKDGRPRVIDFGLARLGGQSAASIQLPSALSGEHGLPRRPGASGEAQSTSNGASAAADKSGEPEDAAKPEDEPMREDEGQAGEDRRPALRARGGGVLNQPGSAATDPVTRVGSISGTPGYMSPEQYIGGDVDAFSDQFSFCAALFEALYGFLPFSGDTIEQLAEAVNGPVRPPPPSSKVPVEVHRALLRGLSVDPKGRFPTMDALIAVLRVEQSHSAEAGSLTRKRMIRTIGTTAILVVALISLRVAQRTMSTRDAVLGSVLLLAGILGAGQLQRDVLLANLFHRRIFLVVTLAVTQNLLQRLVGLRMGWIMKQLFPLEMVVWSGACLALVFLGLRTLWPLVIALLGMGTLATLWPELPKPFILGSYAAVLIFVALAWLRAGRKQAAGAPTPPPKPKS
ncbi:MAG TPA: serine/threonine-protein kinase [Pseudomonadota bacterium]|nr:serine/threonine-protein kinase [Pseudomonadota bacterium]